MLGFLHTAAVHVAGFAELARGLAPRVEVSHVVRPDLLAQALADGVVSPATRDAARAEVARLFAAGATVVVCTCSTLGDAAEGSPRPAGAYVLRVDRPMAERAVSLGRPILVVAAAQTALDTALSLLNSVSKTSLPARALLCERAWQRFQAGDHAGYAAEVAEAVKRDVRPTEVVMLAQASMAPAATLLHGAALEVLASPELGVRAALGLLQTDMGP